MKELSYRCKPVVSMNEKLKVRLRTAETSAACKQADSDASNIFLQAHACSLILNLLRRNKLFWKVIE